MTNGHMCVILITGIMKPDQLRRLPKSSYDFPFQVRKIHVNKIMHNYETCTCMRNLGLLVHVHNHGINNYVCV